VTPADTLFEKGLISFDTFLSLPQPVSILPAIHPYLLLQPHIF
jgi:hypothetical protein